MIPGPAILAIAGGLALAGSACLMLAQGARDADLRHRIGAVLGREATTGPARPPGLALLSVLRQFGDGARRSALLSERAMAELEKTVSAAGFHPARVVSLFIGAKLALLIVLPPLAWLYGTLAGYAFGTRVLMMVGGLVAGMLGPNFALGLVRGPYQDALRRGLPDALDLMVVCAEAGLALEMSVNRVATEMRESNRATASEFATLEQELRLMPDRAQALERLGTRNAVEGYQRLGLTLTQTLRFGTPLSQALRTLASEMRQERLTAFEAKAAKLPALLVLPMTMFILPALFILLIGPALMRLFASL